MVPLLRPAPRVPRVLRVLPVLLAPEVVLPAFFAPGVERPAPRFVLLVALAAALPLLAALLTLGSSSTQTSIARGDGPRANGAYDRAP